MTLPLVHPVVQVLTAPEVMAAAAAVIASVLGALVALVRAQTSRLEASLTRVGVRAAEARAAADASREAVTNEHGTHLRDDVDAVRATLGVVLGRMDAAETARQGDAARQEEMLMAISGRVSRTEAQIDNLREDLRTLDSRATQQDARITGVVHTLIEELHSDT